MARGRDFRTPSREKSWNSIPSLSIDVTSDSTFQASGLFTAGEAVTCVRQRCEYIMTATETGVVAGDECKIAVGLALVSGDAATAGAASLPDPAEEPEYPWLYWAEHAFFFTATSGNNGNVAISVRRVVDTKSMRKLKPRQALTWVGQYADLSGTPPMKVSFGQTRLLLLE